MKIIKSFVCAILLIIPVFGFANCQWNSAWCNYEQTHYESYCVTNGNTGQQCSPCGSYYTTSVFECPGFGG